LNSLNFLFWKKIKRDKRGFPRIHQNKKNRIIYLSVGFYGARAVKTGEGLPKPIRTPLLLRGMVAAMLLNT